MSWKSSFLAWGGLLAILGGVLLVPAFSFPPPPSPPPEKLLPADALIYVGWDGTDAHRAAWEKTAAHDALIGSGLDQVFKKLVRFAEREAGEQNVQRVVGALEHAMRKGVYITASAPMAGQGPPLPQLTIVIPEAGPGAKALTELGQSFAPNEFVTQQIESRLVTRARIPELPAAEVGWWAEGSHLVITIGVGAVDTALGIATGHTPNLSENPLWKQYQKKADFESALVAWVDLATIRERTAGVPLPGRPGENPKRLGEVLEALGLGKVGPLAYRFGFKDEALWSETVLEAPSPRTGLLAFSDQKPISLAELPALPEGTDGFYASRFNWSQAAEGLLRISQTAMKDFGPPGAPSVEAQIAALNQHLGIELRKDLLDPLGDVMVLYGDTRQGLFGMGLGLAISVDDPKTLQSTLNKLLSKLGQVAAQDVRVNLQPRKDSPLRTLEFTEFPFFSPSLAVDGKWLVIGLYPQTVDSFMLRQAGKLPKWSPGAKTAQALKLLPKSYSTISYSDPSEGLRTLLGFAPAGASMIQMQWAEQRRRQLGLPPGALEMPVELADFPPAERVVQKLFPNVTVCSVEPDRVRWTSRSSFPSVPFLGGAGLGSGGASAPVLVALLLPAVQQAREAARRSQTKNQLKMIGLALHNYHDTFNSFPAGTHENEKLKPEKRLSWNADLLPYLDQAPAYNQLDFKESWDAEVNRRIAEVRMPVFINPGMPEFPMMKQGGTHFVGIAGLGKEAPMLPVNNPKAGVFGYNRKTHIRDITDGTSNTMAVTEAKGDLGPWIAGGSATIRALTKKPYINGPDGIGGPYRGGMHVLMTDGSVRFVSENVDPDVLEAISTIAGGEVVGGF